MKKFLFVVAFLAVGTMAYTETAPASPYPPILIYPGGCKVPPISCGQMPTVHHPKCKAGSWVCVPGEGPTPQPITYWPGGCTTPPPGHTLQCPAGSGSWVCKNQTWGWVCK